jgi:hypothetical protein
MPRHPLLILLDARCTRILGISVRPGSLHATDRLLILKVDCRVLCRRCVSGFGRRWALRGSGTAVGTYSTVVLALQMRELHCSFVTARGARDIS